MIHGVGINDAGYTIMREKKSNGRWKKHWVCPFYARWAGMLDRCYSESYLAKKPSYRGCSVSKDWLTFSNFKAWMEKQDWEGKHLDKDLIVKGNRVYSPEHCIFIDPFINTFIKDTIYKDDGTLTGAEFYPSRSKYRSRCRNPITKRNEVLGYFDDPNDAHEAWLNRKNEIANILADTIKDDVVAELVRSYYSDRG